MSIAPLAVGPTAIFSIYMSGACRKPPLGARAMVAIEPFRPLAQILVPSSGSTAISTAVPLPLPSSSPIYNIGASSISPSPMTTVPEISIESSARRMASVAASSADILSPLPTHRPQAKDAASVTLTSSSARLRSMYFLLRAQCCPAAPT